MKKLEILSVLRKAKGAHLRWVMNAHALIEGLPLEKDQVPINGTECVFGRWYYGDGQILHHIQSFRAIEQPHLRLHETYMKIFKLLFVEDQNFSLWDKWLGKAKQAKAQHVAEAQELYKVMEKHSQQIVEQVEILEEVLQKMPEDDIQAWL